jgi:predicted RecA/RadA family phage recombinase
VATNRKFKDGKQLQVVCSDPATPASGDPVIVGQIPGVAQAAEDTADGLTSVDFGGVYLLSVKGVDGGGNSAVAVGDILYYVTADTPKISKKATGVRFGYALEAITSGSTATIQVKVGY